MSRTDLTSEAAALRQKAFAGTITPAEADRLAAINAALARIDSVTPGRGHSRHGGGVWGGIKGSGPTLMAATAAR